MTTRLAAAREKWARIGAELRLRELLAERDLIMKIFPELAAMPGGRPPVVKKKATDAEVAAEG